VSEDTVAVVVTHRRPRLATALVRSLVDGEGLDPSRVLLVVDRDGGLEDPQLEASVQVHRLESHAGPAACFRHGLRAAFADPSVDYAYLCEDDVTLLGLPSPRLRALRERLARYEAAPDGGEPVGAVVAYGRRFGRRAGVTEPYLPPAVGPPLEPVDVAAWGATLVSRRVHDAGVEPDDYWFFGYEDFDFFLKVQRAGLAVLVDRAAALATSAATGTLTGRHAALAGQRPDDSQESWRAYYVARNQFELSRRYGNGRWLLWHLLYSARRWQLARSARERRAILHGMLHGVARRGGRDQRYVRTRGEDTHDPAR
jgi:hypothetical protein